MLIFTVTLLEESSLSLVAECSQVLSPVAPRYFCGTSILVLLTEIDIV